MSRTGVLSDAAVMQHCMKYQAIPMKVADSIIQQDSHTPFGSKKLKHPRHMNRPKTFDTMAKSLTRLNGDVSLRETLEKEYPKQIVSALRAAESRPAEAPRRRSRPRRLDFGSGPATAAGGDDDDDDDDSPGAGPSSSGMSSNILRTLAAVFRPGGGGEGSRQSGFFNPESSEPSGSTVTIGNTPVEVTSSPADPLSDVMQGDRMSRPNANESATNLPQAVVDTPQRGTNPEETTQPVRSADPNPPLPVNETNLAMPAIADDTANVSRRELRQTARNTQQTMSAEQTRDVFLQNIGISTSSTPAERMSEPQQAEPLDILGTGAAEGMVSRGDVPSLGRRLLAEAATMQPERPRANPINLNLNDIDDFGNVPEPTLPSQSQQYAYMNIARNARAQYYNTFSGGPHMQIPQVTLPYQQYFGLAGGGVFEDL